MKVCVLTHTFPKNDRDVSAAFMKELSDGLVEAGNDVVVVTPFAVGFKRVRDKFKIYTYKYVWPENLHVLGYSKTMEADVSLKISAYILLPFLLLFGTLKLYQVVKKEKIDLISVHWILPNGLMALIVSLITGVSYTITLPGTDAYLAHRFKLFGLVAKVIGMRSKAIFSNSALHLKRIVGLGINDKITDVISYPVDVSEFSPSTKGLEDIRKRHNINSKDFVILAVGRLVYKKGFIYLIKAMNTVTKKHTRVRLLIGGEGDLKNDLQLVINKLKLKKNVELIGTISRDEIKMYYNLSDVVVAPSIIDVKGNVDGGPVVSYESMACAKPQIVTSILGVAHEIQNGINGYVIPQKDSSAIADSLLKLIKSSKLRKSMGEANRRLITKDLGTKSIGQKYSSHFKNILKST